MSMFGKPLNEMTEDERSGIESAFQEHIDAYNDAGEGLVEKVQELAEILSTFIRRQPGAMPMHHMLAYDRYLGAFMQTGESLKRHSDEDREAFEEGGLEGVEALHERRQQEQVEAEKRAEEVAKLEEVFGSQVIRAPEPSDDPPQD